MAQSRCRVFVSSPHWIPSAVQHSASSTHKLWKTLIRFGVLPFCSFQNVLCTESSPASGTFPGQDTLAIRLGYWEYWYSLYCCLAVHYTMYCSLHSPQLVQTWLLSSFVYQEQIYYKPTWTDLKKKTIFNYLFYWYFADVYVCVRVSDPLELEL